MAKLLGEYGEEWLIPKLQRWQWQFSTAFSGIGAAESVGVLTIMWCHAMSFPGHTVNLLLLSQAVTSLQSEAEKLLKAKNCPARVPRVCHDFAIEIDQKCQEVLKNTYNVCVFDDVIKFDAKKTKQFCTTHGKNCVVMKKHPKDSVRCRSSASINIDVVRLATVSLKHLKARQTKPWSSGLKVNTAGHNLSKQ